MTKKDQNYGNSFFLWISSDKPVVFKFIKWFVFSCTGLLINFDTKIIDWHGLNVVFLKENKKLTKNCNMRSCIKKLNPKLKGENKIFAKKRREKKSIWKQAKGKNVLLLQQKTLSAVVLFSFFLFFIILSFSLNLNEIMKMYHITSSPLLTIHSLKE